MMDEIPPNQSSEQPLDHPLQDDSRGTRRDSSPRGDDSSESSSESVKNERWESDLEADQMDDLVGREAIEDDEIPTDEVADSSAGDF